MEYQYLTTERLDDGQIMRITLNRPAARNAQNRGLLVELDHAFLAAEKDDEVRVVILAGNGPMFSAGHDLGSEESLTERLPGPDQHESFKGNGGTRKGGEQRMLQEWHYYYQNTLRWRNLRKITIAQVHGKVIAAGLMLMWACDLIIAAEGTTFSDPVGARLGMCGMEYFGHPWEFGPRKAKELLLTTDSIDADEGYRLGMITKVYKGDELAEKTLEFARRIAQRPTMAALMIKESVNQAVDNMGFYNALQACFTIHQANHSHWAECHGTHEEPFRNYPAALVEDGAEDWRKPNPTRPALKDN
ncbi:MAG TPA: enoyl-CoA hydratase [Novosphingobium sp.]|nr:enoyl-CoA hydratase [Novosphingobium sp.]